MNTLTVALASLGGVVLAGVVAHGAWQARRAGPKRALPAAMPPAQEPREPVMDGLGGVCGADGANGANGAVGGGSGGEGGSDGIRLDPTSNPLDAAAIAELPPEAAEPRINRRTVARIDALIDSIASLRLDAPISGAVALAHWPASRRAGGKPFLIEGLDSETGEWEAPLANRRYGEFQGGVQLANRTGALNEIEFSEFVQKLQLFGDGIGAMAEFPDMLEAVAAGRELDAFAANHDAQLAVHLQARSSAWSIAYILQHAGRHGFVPGVVPGRLIMPSADEGAPPVLTLTFDSKAALADDPNLSAVRDVTLSFDVPQTDPQVQPFGAWQASALALSLGMEAGIVDDNGRPLSTEGFSAIGDELGRLYAALEGRDLAAGSAAARRLFS